ncbi:hypothetical protein K439DRAFT_1407419 [Ramaria rubella]|nr:hypothetical protein K439DRAFT_1407419 [Ramaria rubella]
MDAADLARWTRFAAKGGIGRCTALQDCVAQGTEDLMFLKDDEVVVLLQLPEEDQYLGYCEGVVGRFHGASVAFHSKLKKPVFTKRQSTTTTSATTTSATTTRSHAPHKPLLRNLPHAATRLSLSAKSPRPHPLGSTCATHTTPTTNANVSACATAHRRRGSHLSPLPHPLC